MQLKPIWYKCRLCDEPVIPSRVVSLDYTESVKLEMYHYCSCQAEEIGSVYPMNHSFLQRMFPRGYRVPMKANPRPTPRPSDEEIDRECAHLRFDLEGMDSVDEFLAYCKGTGSERL